MISIERGLLSLVLATIFDDEGVGRVVLFTSLLTLDVSPGRLEVLTTTTGLGLTLTTTVRVIHGVHAHSANAWALALPACATGLPGNFLHVVTVSNLSLIHI